MIAWLILVGSLLILLTLPARLFGRICGVATQALIRDRKPPRARRYSRDAKRYATLRASDCADSKKYGRADREDKGVFKSFCKLLLLGFLCGLSLSPCFFAAA